MSTQTQHTIKYKNSSLGLIPEDWEVKKIGKFTKTTAGGTPSTHKLEYWNGDIKWMSSGDLNLKRIYDVEGRITEIGLKNSSTKIIPKKCILIGLAGQGKTRGTVAMNMIELCTNQSVAAIFPSNEFYEDYLYYNLDFRYSELRQLSTGDGGRGGLNLNIINSISVPLPQIPEQTAIANCLSTWDKAIATQNQLIAQKELYKKALMQQLLSGKKRLKGFSEEWKEVSLGDISDYVKGFAFSSNDYKNEGVRIIRISDTTSNSIKDEGAIYVNNNEAPKFNKWKLKEHDLVFTTVGSRPPLYDSMVGKVIKIEKKNEGSLLNQNAVIIRGKEIVNQEFLYNQFRNKRYLEFIESIVRGNANQVSITLENLFSYKIKLPSIEEQKAIADIFQCADEELQLLKNKLQQLKDQKKGLMQILLTGRKRLKY